MKDIISLKKNSEFNKAYQKGKSFVSPILVTYIIKNKKKQVRIGITTSKKTGNAIKRNRSRRIIREAYRQISEYVNSGYDLVFVSRSETSTLKTYDVVKIMKNHLSAAHVLKQ